MNVDVTFEGDNTVLMQQVAKPLLDAAAKAAASARGGLQPPAPPSVKPADLCLACIAKLLAYRQALLTWEIAAELATAGAGAFEANLDRVVRGRLGPSGGCRPWACYCCCKGAWIGPVSTEVPSLSLHPPTLLPLPTPAQVGLGWACVDRSSFDTFAQEVQAAPEGLRPALSLLCQLYGLSRVEAGLPSYLAAGALPGSAAAPLRAATNELCRRLGAGGGRLALALCDGWGIPGHLIQAPVALASWRQFAGGAAA